MDIMSTESMDIVQSEWAPWTCPEYPWTLSRLSSDSMDIVHGAHGFSGHFTDGHSHFILLLSSCFKPYFPQWSWIMSRESMDILQGDSGQCLLSPWTLFSLSGLPGFCPVYTWTLSRLSSDSMDNVHGAHGFSGHFTDGHSHFILLLSSCFKPYKSVPFK